MPDNSDPSTHEPRTRRYFADSLISLIAVFSGSIITFITSRPDRALLIVILGMFATGVLTILNTDNYLTAVPVAVSLFMVSYSYYILRRAMQRLTLTEKYSKLSIIGIMLRRREVAYVVTMAVLALVSTGVPLLSPYAAPQSAETLVWLQALPLAAMLGVFLREQLFRYRVRKGYFGRNEAEAREIIEFILANRNDIDFTDGGRPKRIISAADLEELRTALGPAVAGSRAD